MILPLAPPLHALLFLASALQCPAVPAATVAVVFDNAPPAYVEKHSSAELERLLPHETIFSRGPGEIFMRQGVTAGGITAKVAGLFTSTSPGIGPQECLWFSELRVTVTYAPTIYLASELKSTPCLRQAIVEHELRHANINVITIREYLGRIEQTARVFAARAGADGPVRLEQSQARQNAMLESLRTVLKPAMQDLDRVLGQRQSLVDTRQEYLRLSNACQDEK